MSREDDLELGMLIGAAIATSVMVVLAWTSTIDMDDSKTNEPPVTVAETEQP